MQSELEAARDRVAQRDRDLSSVQNGLRTLEDERRKLGDEHTSDRFSLELELDRVKRDLAAAEGELDRAKGEVDASEKSSRQRELERSQLVRLLSFACYPSDDVDTAGEAAGPRV